MWRLRAPLLALLLMQVILLASSGVTATKKPLGKQETCNMKNHMIEYLRNNGVQIYERPQINLETCQSEWYSFGTCCEQTSIQSTIAKKIDLNNHALTRLAEELQLVVPAVKEYHKKHVEDHLIARRAKNAQMGNGVSFASTHPLYWKFKKGYEELLGNLESMISKEAIRHQAECVAKLNEIISKSACSICSGRSDDFFSSDGRLAISEPTCRTVLRSCNSAWTNMVTIAKSVRETTRTVRIMSSLNEIDTNFGTPEELGFTMNLDSFITNRNLIPIMKKCGSQVTDCSFEHVAALCEQFIHIQAPTYIESSQSQIMRVQSKIESARNSFETSVRELKNATQILETIGNFSLQNETSLTTGVTALETIQKEIVNLSLIMMRLQIENAKLKKLELEKNSSSPKLPMQTNRLIEEIQQVMKQYLLIKHSHLLRITLATKPAEATLKPTFQYGVHKVIPNNVYREEIRTLRGNVEKLWDNFHYYYELLQNPKADMVKTFGQFINRSSYFWKIFLKEDSMTIELLKQFYMRFYDEIARSVSTSETNQWHRYMMVTVPDPRSLSLLLRSSDPVRNSFTMETIVVRDDSASVDLERQTVGVVPFLTTP